MQDMSENFGSFLITSLELFAAAFVLVIGSLVLWAIVAYINAVHSLFKPKQPETGDLVLDALRSVVTLRALLSRPGGESVLREGEGEYDLDELEELLEGSEGEDEMSEPAPMLEG